MCLDYRRNYLFVPSEFPTIQAGIDAAVDGDFVLVDKGTFTGPGNKNISLLGKRVTLISKFGPDSTIIDGENEGRIFYLSDDEDKDTVIDGFTITRGNASEEFIKRGGGIFLDHSSPTIKNCVVTLNTALNAGGIYIEHSSPNISNCVINNNSEGLGAGIYCYSSSPVINACLISNNNGGGICVSVDESHVSIVNCIILGNVGNRAGGIYCGSDSYTNITNCTIVQNNANNGGGIFVSDKCEVIIRNSIIWDNQPEEISEYSPGDNLDVSYCLVGGGWIGDGNLDADPLFLDPENDDFHIQEGSPCVNTGTNVETSFDFDGDARPLNLSWDIGADEISRSGSVLYVVPRFFNLTSSVGNGHEDQRFNIISSGDRDLLYYVSPSEEGWVSISGELSGSLSPADSAEVVLGFDLTGLKVGTYHDTLKVFSNDPYKRIFHIPVRMDMFSDGIINVPEDFSAIQEAINYSLDGAEVLISDGTYTGEGNKKLDYFGKAITVASVNGPEVTIIDCENDGYGFLFENGEGPETRVLGLSIVNGNGSHQGGIECFRSSPTISFCILRNNYAKYGQGGGLGLSIGSHSLVSCCKISENFAEYEGGGVEIRGGVIENCTISDNSSLREGGGIYIGYANSKVEIINCVITDNITSDWEGGGIAVYFSSVDVVNSIIRDNTPDQIAEGYSVLAVCYSDIEGGWSGVGNIDQDPLFYENPIFGLNFLLEPSSPCIDTGDPSIEDSIYDWHPRWPDWYPNGARSDMGAYGGPGNRKWVKYLD